MGLDSLCGVFWWSENIDDVDDKELAGELSSNKGKHPKSTSLFNDEQFQLDARKYVRGVGYVKGAPNMTLWVGGGEMGSSGGERDSTEMATQAGICVPPAQ